VRDVRKGHIEQLRNCWVTRKPRAKRGEVGCNRVLARVRHVWNWAIAEEYCDETPFKRNGVTVVKLHSWAEAPRSRRLQPGEEQRLLAEASSLLHDVIVAALETGCRKGELLSLQWHQVRLAENVLYLPPERTKTAEPRVVPISKRLLAVLERRRIGGDGERFADDSYVFGNEVGERVKSVKTAWENCRRRAGVTGLHFHDLRREFGSRLRESGASDHDVRDWLGHSNITTTSRYLATTSTRLQDVLHAFEARHGDGTAP
jgi:integrase